MLQLLRPFWKISSAFSVSGVFSDEQNKKKTSQLNRNGFEVSTNCGLYRRPVKMKWTDTIYDIGV